MTEEQFDEQNEENEVDITEDSVVLDDVDDLSTAEEEVVEAPVAVEEQTEKQGDWYIVQCFTGHEYRVHDRVKEMMEVKGFQKEIQRILVPEEEVIEIKNNQRQERISKIFPGYLFVQMFPNEEVFYEIRRLPGVAKFIGSKTRPTPVTEEEILKVLRKVGDKTKKIDIDFEVDEVIKVIEGPFRGYSGPISGINSERGKLKALISIFGRETPVELDFDQVEKLVS